MTNHLWFPFKNQTVGKQDEGKRKGKGSILIILRTHYF
jgi:hypothetical protein